MKRKKGSKRKLLMIFICYSFMLHVITSDALDVNYYDFGNAIDGEVQFIKSIKKIDKIIMATNKHIYLIDKENGKKEIIDIKQGLPAIKNIVITENLLCVLTDNGLFYSSFEDIKWKKIYFEGEIIGIKSFLAAFLSFFGSSIISL